jgi:hypothetical protein
MRGRGRSGPEAADLVPLVLALAASAFAVAVAVDADESWWVVWLVLVPAAVAAAPLAFPPERRRPARAVAAVLLAAWSLVALASVGMYFLPAALAMAVAAARRPSAAGSRRR